ncbi:MAG: UDP-N-acetylmuramyl-tripeptide synthetase [Candidatus Pacebacteria bacterium]|nr:UDP-N-acetylmuramyl-tripeptide synthetase [Candidatus Paceibacterota bacterium]
MYQLKHLLHRVTPPAVFAWYHFALALLGAVRYGFPAKKIVVIGVTGTKGKSSTTEYINAICEAAGKKTAVSNSIRFKVGATERRNTTRMSMPGRFGMQAFLREAADAQCDIAILEMTSEGAAQSRHRFIALDALVFTNLAPEHIESHGSLEKYIDAKLSIGKELARSPKRPRIMVVNDHDAISEKFLALSTELPIRFALEHATPWTTNGSGGTFTYKGTPVSVHFPGQFSLENALAAAEVCGALGITPDAVAHGIGNLTRIPGRAEKVDAGQSFDVYVDYAHNPSSLEALFSSFPAQKKICIVGSTGGGRDIWKRPEMGRIAGQLCDEVIVTNEDPYDEDPEAIINAIASGVKDRKPTICLDRREAIAKACRMAQPGDVVLITGKGTDPNIRIQNGKSIPWSDFEVAKEELVKLRATQ